MSELWAARKQKWACLQLHYISLMYLLSSLNQVSFPLKLRGEGFDRSKQQHCGVVQPRQEKLKGGSRS